MKMEKGRRIITDGENGREFKISAGETFQISLPENPTTGYRWEINGSGAPFVGLEKEEYAAPEDGPAGPVLGRGGTRSFIFKAVEPGRTELILRLRRSWEAESESAGSFSVKLEITGLQKQP